MYLVSTESQLPCSRSVDVMKSLHTAAQLRRLERVFCCCSVCETMESYKEGYLMVWANYMSPCNSIFGLNFKGAFYVISVTIATYKSTKKMSFKFQFLKN